MRETMRELADKVALVVGAGCVGDGMGNGRATALTFARAGAVVVCADINIASARETVRLIRDEGGLADAVALDVTLESEVRSVVDAVIDTYGRIDVLDNNVGIASVGGVTELDEAEWDRVFAVNLKGTFFTMKHVIPRMVEQGGGAIVNISSVAGIRWSGVPYASYSASKAGLNHLTRTTAREWARHQVRVNAVLPGLMKTPMVTTNGLGDAYDSSSVEAMWAKRDAQVPMGRMGTAWDVAQAALFLAGDRSKYITGIELVVDGGVALGPAQ
ncbi:NAD(P)-dependent dehydrogenase (short-subunit alcohol dehydrogenase family) [Nocardia tenerifensis]|uniref:NAD(P)-dependent dehydrogenase (Short-subunit alcohol dehydrogenase family) n=1 Tax=Nocardia tenerifensis TaxID=228006 RepID=A0A318KJT1_9NOCA|nr:SDR family NAD(P)-dependent oxidoreductase [Nocardia tenerifensis]PXX68647.1 NAD(P)-dependent dehydrogenase (short-subunit alcohol dehydrogenase family) [Nocardia tenerifensis]